MNDPFLSACLCVPLAVQILGSGMSNKMWDNTVEHAKTCVLNGKLHVYYADDKQNIGVIFNNIFQLMGLIADNQYMSVDLLSESEKVRATFLTVTFCMGAPFHRASCMAAASATAFGTWGSLLSSSAHWWFG